MDLQQLHKLYIERLEAVSGKPVILQCDPKFSGHATIKIATKEQPAHVLLYKPEQKEVFAPDTDVGIDLSKEYRMAIQQER